MPHVDIKCYPGKTEEQKQRLADKIAEDVAEIFGCKLTSVSVSVNDIPQEEWKEKVWDVYIVKEKEKLYKEPGYTME